MEMVGGWRWWVVGDSGWVEVVGGWKQWSDDGAK